MEGCAFGPGLVARCGRTIAFINDPPAVSKSSTTLASGSACGAIRRTFLQIETHANQKSAIDGCIRRQPYSSCSLDFLSFEVNASAPQASFSVSELSLVRVAEVNHEESLFLGAQPASKMGDEVGRRSIAWFRISSRGAEAIKARICQLPGNRNDPAFESQIPFPAHSAFV